MSIRRCRGIEVRVLPGLLLVLAVVGCRTAPPAPAMLLPAGPDEEAADEKERRIRLYGVDFDVDALEDGPAVDVEGTADAPKKRFELFVAPLPFRDPQIGWGGAAGPCSGGPEGGWEQSGSPAEKTPIAPRTPLP